LAWWSRCLLLKVKCLIWWQRLFILKSATLSWLKLSNQHVSSCNVSFLKPPSAFCCVLVVSYALISYSSGICLNPVDEARWVSERVATLERVSLDTNTFLIDPRPCSAIVLLQDRVQLVRESVDGYKKSLTTMYSIMLSPESSTGEFWSASRGFQDKPTYSSLDVAQLGSRC
jgi:hypothetical protein